jgi:hypothetical protein
MMVLEDSPSQHDAGQKTVYTVVGWSGEGAETAAGKR